MAHLKNRKAKDHKKAHSIQNHIVFFGYCSIVFLLLPVLLARNMVDGVQPVRMLALSLGMLITGIFIITSKTGNYPLSLWKNPLILLNAALLIITILSLFFAINLQETYFDIAKSMLFSAFLLLTVPVLFSRKNWPEVVAKFVVVSSLIAIGVGFYQYVNDVLLIEEKFLPDGRSVIYNVKGLMAHKNQYAINLMLMLPFVIYGAFTSRKLWRAITLTALALMVTMIVIIHTRSVWIAIILSGLGLLLFAGLHYQLMNISLRTRNIAMISAFTAVVGGVAIIAVLPTEHEFTRLAQIKSIANPEAGNNKFRLKIWELTTRMIADHPLTGVGAGNWKLRAGEYFHDYAFEGHELNWVRPHNDPLWVFAEKGVAGIIIYLLLVLFTAIYLFKAFLRQTDARSRLLVLLITGGFFSYHFTSLFSFPSERINQQVFLWIFTAIAIVLNHNKAKSQQPTIKGAMIAGVLVLLLFPAIYSSAVISSDKALFRARVALEKADWQGLQKEMDKAENWSRNMDTEAMPFGWYRGLAYSKTGNPEKALESYLTAHAAHPGNVTVLHNTAIVYARLGNSSEALNYLDKVLKIVPSYKNSIVAKASILTQNGRFMEAFETLKTIQGIQRDQSVKDNLNNLRRILLQNAVNKAIAARSEGLEIDAESIVGFASRIFYNYYSFGELFDELYRDTLDPDTRLRVLQQIPPKHRSDEVRGIIHSLKQNSGN
jgi:O-antigen ligase